MMSASQIVAMSRKAARDSARNHVVPILVEQEDLVSDEVLSRHLLRSIPFIGDRVPRGWKLLDASQLLGSDRNCVPYDGPEANHFMQCDSSGMGAEWEPSFTRAAFLEAVRKIGPGKGYAIVEAGQFQVVIGVFQPR